jgi:hypothetical protein
MSENQLERIRQVVEMLPQVNIVKPSDLLFMPRVLKNILALAFHNESISITDLALGLELDLSEARIIAALLAQKGYLQIQPPEENGIFITRFGTPGTRSGKSPLEKI